MSHELGFKDAALLGVYKQPFFISAWLVVQKYTKNWICSRNDVAGYITRVQMTISFCTRAWLHKLLRTRSLRLQRHHEAHFYTLHATIHNKISSTSQRLCNVHKSTPSGGYPVNKRHAPHRRVQNSKKGAFFLYFFITAIGRNV